METKKCKDCLVEKDLVQFYICRNMPTPSCKDCIKERVKRYQEKNKDKVKGWKKKYAGEHIEEHREKNREYARLPHIKEKFKQYREKNKEKRREYAKNWAAEKRKDPKYRLDGAISHAIWDHLHCRGISKGNRKWEDIVGYTKQDLINHLESFFKEGMTWDNYGTYWHIDHIRPKSWFVYTSMDDEEFKKCWALSNLQPLEATVNCSKNNKYEG